MHYTSQRWEARKVMAGAYDFSVDQGSTKRVSLIYQYRTGYDTDGNPVFAAYSLSGCQARMQVRAKVNGPVLIDLNSQPGGGIKIEDGNETGRVDIVLSSSHTSGLEISQAVYDLTLTFPSGDVVRLIQGRIDVSLSVTE